MEDIDGAELLSQEPLVEEVSVTGDGRPGLMTTDGDEDRLFIFCIVLVNEATVSSSCVTLSPCVLFARRLLTACSHLCFEDVQRRHVLSPSAKMHLILSLRHLAHEVPDSLLGVRSFGNSSVGDI